MAKLSMAQRKKIKKSSFGIPSKAPGRGSFPINDKNHARAALRFIKHAPASARAGIRAKANKKLGKKSSGTGLRRM